jgi:hypothetical protein
MSSVSGGARKCPEGQTYDAKLKDCRYKKSPGRKMKEANHKKNMEAFKRATLKAKTKLDVLTKKVEQVGMDWIHAVDNVKNYFKSGDEDYHESLSGFLAAQKGPSLNKLEKKKEALHIKLEKLKKQLGEAQMDFISAADKQMNYLEKYDEDISEQNMGYEFDD